MIARVAHLSPAALSSAHAILIGSRQPFFSTGGMIMDSPDIETNNRERAPLDNARLAFIGCGVMAEAIIAGLLRRQLVDPDQIVGSHPRAARREELYAKYGARIFESNREAALAAHHSESANETTPGASL